MGDAEAALVDAIADGCAHAQLAAADPGDMPVTRKLALLVRPALIAGPGKVFVWSDWSAIEARVTPWLAASPEADEVLEVFRASDADPARPDIYTVAAADILHKEPSAITKAERQTGKVATLALGFGGSVGALQSMALNYRVAITDEEARRIVDAWREANPWARDFWGAHRDGESFGLWGAALTAWEQPGRITTAGRLGFAYRDDYLGGSLFMALPSGRLLTYPRPKWRDVDVLDKDGKPTGETRRELSFQRAHGRAKLWHGTLAENATQACAADVLRETATRIESDPALAFMPIRLHTHDELVCRGRRGARRRGESDPAPRDADPAGLGRGPAAAVGRKCLRVLHQSEGGVAMNARRRLASCAAYQERAATFLYERDAALLVAPLGAGKSTAALTAIAELVGDGHRRHALVVAPKLVATTVWPQEVAAWPHLRRTAASPSSTAPQSSASRSSCRRRRGN